MKFQSSIKNKKIPLIISIIVLLIGISAIGVYIMLQPTSEADKPPITVENNYVEDKDQPLINQPSQNDQNATDEDKIIAPSPQSSNGSDLEKPNISRADITRGDIRVVATFTMPSSGTCELLLEKQGYATIVKQAKVVVAPSYYTCNGFRVPITELPSKGEWQAKIIHKQDSSSIESDIKIINVE